MIFNITNNTENQKKPFIYLFIEDLFVIEYGTLILAYVNIINAQLIVYTNYITLPPLTINYSKLHYKDPYRTN